MKVDKKKFIFEKIIPIVLIIALVVRLLIPQVDFDDFITLESSPIDSKFVTFMTLLSIWFKTTAILIVLLRPFFGFKLVRNLNRYVVGFILVLNIFTLMPTMTLLQCSTEFSLLFFVWILEIVLSFILFVYYSLKDKDDKNDVKSILIMLAILVGLLVASMPAYFFQFVFGYGNAVLVVKDITFEHRTFLYIGIIIPVFLYFLLRNKSEEVIRFTLIYISLATLIVFVVNYDYTNIIEPWRLPFHLCNTAMFIIPLCLIFKMKRLFYFTYFINVLGAVFAMLMPNYDTLTNIFSMRVFNFWYNHWIASFMPLLIVALKQFKRPTIKQFVWSMIGFLGYFVLVLVLNVVFTAMGKDVDYFFINSDFIADKLGTWAEQLFNMKVAFDVGGLTLEFHPIYQIIFFFVYVILGLGVWFVYNEFFIIADKHFELNQKVKKMRLDKIARRNAISKERREEIMNTTSEIKLELKHFSKKYATSKVYAVKDANFEVHGGEIFGFLGPNGAGKSTIIKSIVGIQPISEGHINICGYDVQTESTNSKANIGYVPDHYALYEKLTGREYINYIADIFDVPQEERDARINKYIKIFELEHSIDSKIRTYSHGMKQKITIMSALVHNPKVWILDEPLTGLDPNSIYQVKECMKQHAAEGNIVFFSSHLIDIVEKLCDKIAIIKKGQIQCVKTLEQIESSGVTLEQFYLNTISGNEE